MAWWHRAAGTWEGVDPGGVGGCGHECLSAESGRCERHDKTILSRAYGRPKSRCFSPRRKHPVGRIPGPAPPAGGLDLGLLAPALALVETLDPRGGLAVRFHQLLRLTANVCRRCRRCFLQRFQDERWRVSGGVVGPYDTIIVVLVYPCRVPRSARCSRDSRASGPRPNNQCPGPARLWSSGMWMRFGHRAGPSHCWLLPVKLPGLSSSHQGRCSHRTEGLAG